ncbi:MAG: hypothetical protein H6506_00845 [Calditrichaeota bacterium]|nr:hypothetical protein [Calditrichota bacterium]MCB9366559.1 hypothetical protein [Calditrichota bacterium]MCB9391183.1 hypothetical protein [Calditrichota bacterium]
MKREIPILITLVFGVFMIVQFFIPHPAVNDIANRLQNWAIIVISFSYVLGSANILRINGELVYRRAPGWPYKLVLVIAFFTMATPGLILGIAEGSWTNDRLFTFTYVPLASTMYASLAFYIASAAFRAFRVRTWQASVLAITALIVMLGRIPVSHFIWQDLPGIVDWIMGVPNAVAQRGILIGAALGAIATGLKVILGIERSYLGRE